MADGEMTKRLLNLIEQLRHVEQVSYGFNKCERLVADRQARIVILAADTSPFGFLIRIPLLCEDENIKYVYVERQADLAAACGKTKPVCAVAITFTPEDFMTKTKNPGLRQQESNNMIDLSASKIEEEIEKLEAEIQAMLDNGDFLDEADFIQLNEACRSCNESSASSAKDLSDEEIEDMAARLGARD